MKPCQKSRKSCSRSGVSRRTFLGGVTAGTLASSVVGCSPGDAEYNASLRAIFGTSGRRQSSISKSTGMPGKYPGRVVEVAHAGSMFEGKRDSIAVRAMIEEGMSRLVPDEETPVDAWQSFFQKGDRIGIKVVPVGKVPKAGASARFEGPMVDLKRPGSVSSHEVVHEVIRSLELAGIKRSDILVFDRYRDEFIQAGYRAMLPDGVHWECSSSRYDESQLEIDGQIRGEPRRRNVAGYDRDVFRELAFCQPPGTHDSLDDRRFRSHLSKIITQKVDKVISIPVLKDHRSAGVTLALKNMSHGMVNNVARSHIFWGANPSGRGRTLNHCQTFIPAAVSLPQTRDKCVLQILDGLLGTYEGGPGSWNRTFATWEYKSLLFATDPVALDSVGWNILDHKRSQHGWPSVANMGTNAQPGATPQNPNGARSHSEVFHIRQPQHVPLASLLGLGVFEQKDIKHQVYTIG